MDELKGHVAKKIGPIARPDEILFAMELPKTRSGKIMRRLLRDIADGRTLGDTTTLADPAVVAKLKEQYQEERRRQKAEFYISREASNLAEIAHRITETRNENFSVTCSSSRRA
jgi:hypothetical protein